MTSKISHAIKSRKTPKDVFITPLPLAKKQIDMIDIRDGDVWYDPFKNSGSYFNQFPETGAIHEWSEILDDKDFFEFDGKIDIISSNPPYSFLDRIITKSIELNPRVISYLIGQQNFTSRRIEIMNNAGYSLTRCLMLKFFEWYGMGYIIQFEKIVEISNVVEFDITVWRSLSNNTEKKKTNRKCGICRKEGHTRRNCPDKK